MEIGKRYAIVLYGHAFTRFPEAEEPAVIARFDGYDGDFAVFTLEKPMGKEYPEAWAGTYRIPKCVLEQWRGESDGKE
jgi:hypothetical protein